MLQRLWLVGGFALLLGLIWFMSIRATPHRGFLRGMEKLCVGIILFYCLGLLLRPLGIIVPHGPVASAFAGALGLPGAVLSLWVGGF